MPASQEPQLILVIGLPASGKTTRARELEKKLSLERLSDCHAWHPKRSDERHELYSALRSGHSFVIDSSGFCESRYLDDFLRELNAHVPGVRCEIEYFDNHPLQCMCLAIQDQKKPYGGNGALARVSQIIRDCPAYQPDESKGAIQPVLPCRSLTRYQAGVNAEYDAALREIESVISPDGPRLEGAKFIEKPRTEQDVMNQTIRRILLAFESPTICFP